MQELGEALGVYSTQFSDLREAPCSPTSHWATSCSTSGRHRWSRPFAAPRRPKSSALWWETSN